METLRGESIIGVNLHYENIIIVNDEREMYFIHPKTIKAILSKFEFKKCKKRTRTWLEVDAEKFEVSTI